MERTVRNSSKCYGPLSPARFDWLHSLSSHRAHYKIHDLIGTWQNWYCTNESRFVRKECMQLQPCASFDKVSYSETLVINRRSTESPLGMTWPLKHTLKGYETLRKLIPLTKRISHLHCVHHPVFCVNHTSARWYVMWRCHLLFPYLKKLYCGIIYIYLSAWIPNVFISLSFVVQLFV